MITRVCRLPGPGPGRVCGNPSGRQGGSALPAMGEAAAEGGTGGGCRQQREPGRELRAGAACPAECGPSFLTLGNPALSQICNINAALCTAARASRISQRFALHSPGRGTRATHAYGHLCCIGCRCLQAAEHAAWGLVRRTQAHPRFADCYALPSYEKRWRRLERRPADCSAAPVLFGLDWCAFACGHL